MKQVLAILLVGAALSLGSLSPRSVADDGPEVLGDSGAEGDPQCPLPPSIDIRDWKLVALDVPTSHGALAFLARTRPDHMLLLLHLASVNSEVIPVDSRYIKVRSPITKDDDRLRAGALLEEILLALRQEENTITRDEVLMMAQRAFPVEEYEWQSVCAQAHGTKGFDTKLVIVSGVEACNQMALAFPDPSSMDGQGAITEVSMNRLPDERARVRFPGGIDAEGQDAAPVYAIVDISHVP